MNDPQRCLPAVSEARADALTLQQIITFCHVYEHGGYADAADALGLAGPTLWEQVKSLERIYQTRLFVRVGRNIRPSPSGQTLYDMLRPILASVVSTFERLGEATQSSVQHINLVTGVRMMLEELGSPLRKFQQAFPAARLKLMTADNATAQQLVLDGQADTALLIEPPQEMLADGIAFERLYPLEYLAALPRRHRLIRQAQLTLADLTQEPLIVGTPNTIGRKMLEHARFRLGIMQPLQIVAETDNSATTIACVRAGLGVGIIASRAQGNLTKQVVTRSITGEVGQVNVVAAYRRGRQLTQTLRTLLQMIQDGGRATLTRH